MFEMHFNNLNLPIALVDYVPKTKKKCKNLKKQEIQEISIKTNNIQPAFSMIQAYDSVMCQYSCKHWIDFLLKGKSFLYYSSFKSLWDYTNLFYPTELERNDKAILKYCQSINFFLHQYILRDDGKNIYCVQSNKYRKFKNLKYHLFSIKH